MTVTGNMLRIADISKDDSVMSEGEGIEVCRTVGTLIVKIRTQSDTMYQHPGTRHK